MRRLRIIIVVDVPIERTNIGDSDSVPLERRYNERL